MLARSVDFHKDFCRVQEKAAQFAAQFNRRLNGPAGFRVSFVTPGALCVLCVCVCVCVCVRVCVCVCV